MLLSVCETVLVSEPLRVRLQLVPAGSGRLPERRGLRDGVRGPPSPSGSCRSIVRRTSAPTKPVFPTASLRLLSRLDTATRFTAAYKRRRPQSTFAPIRLPNSIPGCPMDMNDVDPHRDEDGDMSVPLLVDGIDGVAETVLANHEDTLEAASLEDVSSPYCINGDAISMRSWSGKHKEAAADARQCRLRFFGGYGSNSKVLRPRSFRLRHSRPRSQRGRRPAGSRDLRADPTTLSGTLHLAGAHTAS